MSNIALVIIPGSEGLQKAVDHPAGLSSVKGNTKSKIPYTSHEERMKLSQMATSRMRERTYSDANYGLTPTVDRKGRVAGGKAPHNVGATGVSGMGSSASNSFDAKAKGNSKMGSSAPESASTHQPKSIRSVK